jgi:hypothetical protein
MSSTDVFRDPRDPYGRAEVGVQITDSMRRQPSSGAMWKVPQEIDDLQMARQDIKSAKVFTEGQLERLRRQIEGGRRNDAVVQCERDYGLGHTPEEVVAKGQAVVDECEQELAELDFEITRLLWTEMYPDAPATDDYDRNEHRELHAGKNPLNFDHRWNLMSELWYEICDYFADRNFEVNAEILMSIDKRIGIGSFCQFVYRLREGDMKEAQRYCDLVTDEERRGVGDCHNRLMMRRGTGGSPVIVIDQPANPDYLPPLVMRSRVGAFAHPRFGARGRESEGSKPTRRRGSRRATSRSSGGGSSGDDPDPEPSARTGAYGLDDDRILWDIAVTSFGALIGDCVMGLEGVLVGGVVAYFWGCWRWHRRAAHMRRD